MGCPILSIVRARSNVGPQLIQFVGTNDALPRRHLAPATHNHLIETCPSIGLLLLQIGHSSGASEFHAMASCAVLFVDLLTGLDLVLRRCIGAGAEHNTGGGTRKKYLTHHNPIFPRACQRTEYSFPPEHTRCKTEIN